MTSPTAAWGTRSRPTSAAVSHAPSPGRVSNGSGLASDYTVTLTPGALTVTPFAFSYTIANDSHVYGTTDSFSTLASTINTGVNGENLDIAYGSVGNTVTAHVGSSSPIAGTLSNGSGLASDYTVTLTPGALTVTPFAFSYTIANDSHVYGTTDSFANDAGTSTINTGVNSENLDIAYSSVGGTRSRPTSAAVSYADRQGRCPTAAAWPARLQRVTLTSPREADGDAIRLQLHHRQ